MYVLWFVFNVNRASIKLLTNLTCVCFIVIYRHATHLYIHTHIRRHTHMQRTYICRHTCSNKLAQIYHVCQLLPVLSLIHATDPTSSWAPKPQHAPLSRNPSRVCLLWLRQRRLADTAVWCCGRCVRCEKFGWLREGSSSSNSSGNWASDWRRLTTPCPERLTGKSLITLSRLSSPRRGCLPGGLAWAHDPKVEGGGWKVEAERQRHKLCQFAAPSSTVKRDAARCLD